MSSQINSGLEAGIGGSSAASSIAVGRLERKKACLVASCSSASDGSVGGAIRIVDSASVKGFLQEQIFGTQHLLDGIIKATAPIKMKEIGSFVHESPG
jgi:hypothetical protein